jgi:hypothetical protein
LGPKREEATVRQRNLRNLELYDLYCSQKYFREQIKEAEAGGTWHELGRSSYRILVGKGKGIGKVHPRTGHEGPQGE